MRCDPGPEGPEGPPGATGFEGFTDIELENQLQLEIKWQDKEAIKWIRLEMAIRQMGKDWGVPISHITTRPGD